MRPESDHNKLTSYPKISSYLAAALATATQTVITFPADVASKRMQHHSIKLSLKPSFETLNNLRKVIYPKPQSTLWDGLMAALAFRLIAATITFGSQPLFKKHLENEYGFLLSQPFGTKYVPIASNIISGCLFALVEVIFLPLDRWKVLRQLNNETSLNGLIQQERFKLYAGASITAARNLSAFPTLFGVSSALNQYFTSTSENESITLSQRTLSAAAGAMAATIASNPTDVLKTRIQAQTSENKEVKPKTAQQIAREILHKEGVFGFWRGFTPRAATIIPRLTFLKALSETLAPEIDKALDLGTSEIKRRFSK